MALLTTLVNADGTAAVVGNTLYLGLIPAITTGFLAAAGMSPKGLWTCTLTLSAILLALSAAEAIRLLQSAGLVYFYVMPGACAGAMAALVYDNRVRRRGRDPVAWVHFAWIAGGVVLEFSLLLLLLFLLYS